MANKTKKAFTLIELSLSVAIMALLLIIVTTLVLSLIGVYRKGIAINAVNTVGRSIIEDFQNSVSSSSQSKKPEVVCLLKYSYNDTPGSAYRKCVDAHASLLTSNEVNDASGHPRYGVFCTGSYSYIWNSGYALRSGGAGGIDFIYDGDSKTNFKLIKVYDNNREVCQALLNNTDYSTNTGISNITITASLVDGETVTDLISESDTNLAIYYLYVSTPTINSESSNSFYSGSFILATLTGGVNIMTPGNYCKPPGDASGASIDEQSNFNYCAINKFNFAVQGNGG